MPLITDWKREYEQRGALWIHDGNPKRPHALLTSGNHSGGFFNSELVMEDPSLLHAAGFALHEKLESAGLDMEAVHRVVGPAMGAITIAHCVAFHIGEQRGRPCLRAYTEKEKTEGEGEIMVFRRTMIKEFEYILAVEDVLTTGGSVKSTAKAVTNVGGVNLPFIAVLVNRSGLENVNGSKVISLVNRPMPIWKPDQCQLCNQGSVALRPKGKENWERLKASY